MNTKPVLLCCALMAGCATGPLVELADEGKPSATIVVQKNAPEVVSSAAKDLRHYVKEICGVGLPLETDGAKVEGTGIYIGICGPTSKSDLPPSGLNPETYAIAVRDGDVYLTGRYPPAISFAVVSFIEDELGVRWYAPDELWEYVPKSSAGRLRVRVAPRVNVPDWSPRVWSGHHWTESWRAWKRRNKVIAEPPLPFRNFQNYMHKVFDPAKYAESHPEYYPLADGKRWIPQRGDRAWRPCESNPEVQRITIETARNYLDQHPEHNSFSLGMDDINVMCGCSNCRAMDAAPDDYEKRRFSDRHYRFVNTIARELAKTHPDKYVGTLCYSIARELPRTVDSLEPNVFITMTQCCPEWFRPGRRQEDMELTSQWRQRCEHMNRYDYMGLGFITPRVFPHAMAEAMKFDHSLGFHGMYIECYTILANTAPMMWMTAKLQWDTEQDADALLNEFYERMFGEAAAAMEEYYGLLERSWMTPRPGRNGWGHRNLRTQAGAMAVEDVDAAEKLLDKAMSQASDSTVRKRIETVAAGLRYGSYPIRALDLTERLAASEMETPDNALSVLKRLEELASLSAQREDFWKEALQRKDLLGESLRGLQGRGYLVTYQIGQIEGAAFGAFLAALEALKSSSPEEARRQAKRFTESYPGPMGDYARVWLTVQDGQLENLLANPGFEVAGTNQEKPEEDWKTEGAPPGWSIWHRPSRDTRFELLKGEGRSGSVAAAISEASSACILQNVSVQAGRRYLCSVYARPLKPGTDCAARLNIRWRTRAGSWHSRRDLEASASITSNAKGWQRLTCIVEPPEGASSLVFLIAAKGQEAGVKALFEDAAVYLVPEK